MQPSKQISMYRLKLTYIHIDVCTNGDEHGAGSDSHDANRDDKTMMTTMVVAVIGKVVMVYNRGTVNDANRSNTTMRTVAVINAIALVAVALVVVVPGSSSRSYSSSSSSPASRHRRRSSSSRKQAGVAVVVVVAVGVQESEATGLLQKPRSGC